jgi:hypothetical protein
MHRWTVRGVWRNVQPHGPVHRNDAAVCPGLYKSAHLYSSSNPHGTRYITNANSIGLTFAVVFVVPSHPPSQRLDIVRPCRLLADVACHHGITICALEVCCMQRLAPQTVYYTPTLLCLHKVKNSGRQATLACIARIATTPAFPKQFSRSSRCYSCKESCPSSPFSHNGGQSVIQGPSLHTLAVCRSPLSSGCLPCPASFAVRYSTSAMKALGLIRPAAASQD